MHVLLIGLRCSGKSTVGRLLAERLRRPFIDLDDCTAAILNCATAGDALRTRGEPAFREAETAALREVLTETTPAVVALGGGTPTAPGAAALLLDAQGAGRAMIVYLRAVPEVLAERLRAEGDTSRPSLTGTGAVEEVATLFQQRDAMYSRLADRIVDAKLSCSEIAKSLAEPTR